MPADHLVDIVQKVHMVKECMDLSVLGRHLNYLKAELRPSHRSILVRLNYVALVAEL